MSGLKISDLEFCHSDLSSATHSANQVYGCALTKAPKISNDIGVRFKSSVKFKASFSMDSKSAEYAYGIASAGALGVASSINGNAVVNIFVSAST